MAELLVPDGLPRAPSRGVPGLPRDGRRRPLGTRALELEALRADGWRFPVELSITSIDVGDTPVFTAYVRDITERKALDRLKDELVSTVSHELRTPLASIRGFVELLLSASTRPRSSASSSASSTRRSSGSAS